MKTAYYTPEQKEAIWKRIIFLCRRKGWTLTDASVKAGLSRSYVASMRSKERVPSIAALSKLADLFKVSVDYLLTGVEDKDPITDKLLARLTDRFIDDAPFRKCITRLVDASDDTINAVNTLLFK